MSPRSGEEKGRAVGVADGPDDDVVGHDLGTTVEPLLLSLDVADATLLDRLARLLDDVPGLRIVPAGEAADAVVGDARTGPPEGSPELTPRELEVLDILAEGASNREIAERLGISVHTAKFHVGSILDKLDSSGRTDAVAYALRVGVLRL